MKEKIESKMVGDYWETKLYRDGVLIRESRTKLDERKIDRLLEAIMNEKQDGPAEILEFKYIKKAENV